MRDYDKEIKEHQDEFDYLRKELSDLEKLRRKMKPKDRPVRFGVDGRDLDPLIELAANCESKFQEIKKLKAERIEFQENQSITVHERIALALEMIALDLSLIANDSDSIHTRESGAASNKTYFEFCTFINNRKSKVVNTVCKKDMES